MKLIKVLKSKLWDILFPLGVFFIVALAEGGAYWVAGVAAVVWVLTAVIKYTETE